MTAEALAKLADEARAASKIAAKLATMKPPSTHNAAKDGERRKADRVQMDRHLHEAHCLAVEAGIAGAQPWRYVERRIPMGFGRDALVTPRKPANTPSAIASSLRELASLMELQGDALVYYGGMGPIAQHGFQMRNAADMTREWADGMDAELAKAMP